MSGDIVVFAGAGASVAVDRGYPTTAGFFEHLKEQLNNEALNLLNRAASILQEERPDTTIDVEQILWLSQELIDSLQNVAGPTSIPHKLIAATGHQKIFGEQVADSGVFSKLRKLRGKLEEFNDSINANVFSLYAKQPSRSSLKENWLPLLENLKKSELRFDIFTTNYDLIIEAALQEADLQEMLASSDDVSSSEINLSRWENQLTEKAASGLLTKLHGSVNWQRSPSGKIHVSYPELGGGPYREQLSERGVIYPGFKGRPETSPFGLFHDYLENAISDAKIILCIGFAFRDEHINEIFAQRATKCRMININFAPAHFAPPFDNTVEVIELERGFDTKSVEEAIRLMGLK